MAEPLPDASLDQLRTARSGNGCPDLPESRLQIRRIRELMKMGPTPVFERMPRPTFEEFTMIG